MRPRSDRNGAGDDHPSQEDLRTFMRGDLPRPRAVAVVRHLLRGCRACSEVTSELWGFGEERPRPFDRNPPARASRQAGIWL